LKIFLAYLLRNNRIHFKIKTEDNQLIEIYFLVLSLTYFNNNNNNHFSFFQYVVYIFCMHAAASTIKLVRIYLERL